MMLICWFVNTGFKRQGVDITQQIATVYLSTAGWSATALSFLCLILLLGRITELRTRCGLLLPTE